MLSSNRIAQFFDHQYCRKGPEGTIKHFEKPCVNSYILKCRPRVLGQLPPKKIAPRIIAPRTIAPWMIPPEQLAPGQLPPREIGLP